MINGEVRGLFPAIGAFKIIPDQDVFFGQGDPGPVKRSDHLDQAHHHRHLNSLSSGAVDDPLRAPDDLHFSFFDQSQGAFPVDHV